MAFPVTYRHLPLLGQPSAGPFVFEYEHIGYSLGTDNKPVRSSADEVERITGHQGQDLSAGGIENFNVLWAYDLRGHYAILIHTLQRGERNYIVHPDVSQRPEESIAVRRDTHIAELPRQRRTGNMAGRPTARLPTLSF